MSSNFRKQMLQALGRSEPADMAEALLLEAAERYYLLSNRAYAHVRDAGDNPSLSSNVLGAGNQYVKSTGELLKILKLLNLIKPSGKSKGDLQTFFNAKKRSGKKK